MRWLPLAILGALLNCVAGCEDPKEVLRDETLLNKPPRKNALISLRMQKLDRPDRMAPLSEGGTTLESASPPEEVVWRSERLSERILQDLKKLVRGQGNSESMIAEEFLGSAPRPSQLKKIEENASGWQLWQAKGEEPPLNRQQFVKALANQSPQGFKLKVIRIEINDSQVQAELFVEYPDKERSATALWEGRWQLAENEDLLLTGLKRKNYRELRGKAGPMFAEVTATVLGATPHFSSQFQRGIADWAGEISKFSDLVLTGHHGIAVGDVDGDGREDVFVCDGGGLPNRLYRQLADGSAEDISAKAGLDWYEDSRAALLIDLDNDGDQDLVVATVGVIAFAENDGTGKFTLRGGFPGAQYPYSLSAADYDLDGDLDVYVCLYGKSDIATVGRGFDALSPIPFEDARNGGRNVLLENLGRFGFADVTAEVDLMQSNDRWSFAASWEDYDRDGDSDLYVANDFGKNTLYRNDSGRFTEVAQELGVEDLAAGMSVSWGDYNRDGKFDLYVGNMFSSAGGRVAYQEQFAKGRKEEALSGLQRMAQGNSLFAGGKEWFAEQPDILGASMGRWAWSSGFVDVDNDGWEDLVIANGYLTGWETKKDL